MQRRQFLQYSLATLAAGAAAGLMTTAQARGLFADCDRPTDAAA